MSSKKHGQSPESHYNLRGNVQGYEKMLKEENELLKAKVEEQKTKLYGSSRKRKNCNGAVHADGKRKMLRYFVMIVPDVTSIDDLV